MRTVLNIAFISVFLGVLLLASSSPAAGPPRIWTATNGDTMEGRFIRVHQGNVVLFDRFGRVVKYPVNRFSAADQKYMRDFYEKEEMELPPELKPAPAKTPTAVPPDTAPPAETPDKLPSESPAQTPQDESPDKTNPPATDRSSNQAAPVTPPEAKTPEENPPVEPTPEKEPPAETKTPAVEDTDPSRRAGTEPESAPSTPREPAESGGRDVPRVAVYTAPSTSPLETTRTVEPAPVSDAAAEKEKATDLATAGSTSTKPPAEVPEKPAVSVGQWAGIAALSMIIFTVAGWFFVASEKQCTKCENVVSSSSKAGDRCPHCGAVWTIEHGKDGSVVSKTSAARIG